MTIATTQQSPISHCLSQLNDQTYSRQSSTPLSFHSVVSSTTDEQIPSSPLIISKTQIFTDIVNELIQGAKGLDKLSYSLANFTKSIHDFIRLTTDKQTEKVKHLENELEKYVNIFGLFFFEEIYSFVQKMFDTIQSCEFILHEKNSIFSLETFHSNDQRSSR